MASLLSAALSPPIVWPYGEPAHARPRDVPAACMHEQGSAVSGRAPLPTCEQQPRPQDCPLLERLGKAPVCATCEGTSRAGGVRREADRQQGGHVRWTVRHTGRRSMGCAASEAEPRKGTPSHALANLRDRTPGGSMRAMCMHGET